jgi:WD40 repeat protein
VEGHNDDINSVVHLNRGKDDNVFLSGGDDGIIYLWD